MLVPIELNVDFKFAASVPQGLLESRLRITKTAVGDIMKPGRSGNGEKDGDKEIAVSDSRLEKYMAELKKL